MKEIISGWLLLFTLYGLVRLILFQRRNAAAEEGLPQVQ
jgi:hypothetical protein